MLKNIFDQFSRSWETLKVFVEFLQNILTFRIVCCGNFFCDACTLCYFLLPPLGELWPTQSTWHRRFSRCCYIFLAPKQLREVLRHERDKSLRNCRTWFSGTVPDDGSTLFSVGLCVLLWVSVANKCNLEGKLPETAPNGHTLSGSNSLDGELYFYPPLGRTIEKGHVVLY